MSKILDLPSKKIFIKDLQQAVKCVASSTENQHKSIKEWQSKGRTFSVVWVQGTVLQVSNDSDMMLVDDGTGVVKVIGCCKIPHMSEKLKHDFFAFLHPIMLMKVIPERHVVLTEGQYAMVIGQLMAVGNIPVMRALKFQNLTNHIVDLETCWILEVLEHILNKE